MTKTIEQLTARVRELEEENARLKVDRAKKQKESVTIFDVNCELTARVRELEEENAELHEQVDMQIPKLAFAQLQEKLAASQAYAEQVRGALKASDDLLRDLPASGGFYGLAVMENNEQALATPISTEALDAYVAEKVKEATINDAATPR